MLFDALYNMKTYVWCISVNALAHKSTQLVLFCGTFLNVSLQNLATVRPPPPPPTCTFNTHFLWLCERTIRPEGIKENTFKYAINQSALHYPGVHDMCCYV